VGDRPARFERVFAVEPDDIDARGHVNNDRVPALRSGGRGFKSRPALVTFAPYSSNPAVPTEVSRESAEVRGSNPDAQEDALNSARPIEHP